VACGDCHRVPTEVGSPGHIDSDLPVEVFPPGLVSFAFTDGAMPSWKDGKCANVYCHGGGRKLAADRSAVERAPAWSGGGVACGTACHGAPPEDGKHPPVTVRGCVNCHPNTVDPTGAIIFTGGTTKHMNGVVDGR
jgi:predicted CxxxxCH...CXXCH cytochrome family protein